MFFNQPFFFLRPFAYVCLIIITQFLSLEMFCLVYVLHVLEYFVKIRIEYSKMRRKVCFTLENTCKDWFTLENALTTYMHTIFSFRHNQIFKNVKCITFLSSYYFLAPASPPRHAKFLGSFLSLITCTVNLILVCVFQYYNID